MCCDAADSVALLHRMGLVVVGTLQVGLAYLRGGIEILVEGDRQARSSRPPVAEEADEFLIDLCQHATEVQRSPRDSQYWRRMQVGIDGEKVEKMQSLGAHILLSVERVEEQFHVQRLQVAMHELQQGRGQSGDRL